MSPPLQKPQFLRDVFLHASPKHHSHQKNQGLHHRHATGAVTGVNGAVEAGGALGGYLGGLL